MIAAFRSADGRRIGQQPKREMSWRERNDGMVEVRVRLPKEEAAVLLAATEVAKATYWRGVVPGGWCRETSTNASKPFSACGCLTRISKPLDGQRDRSIGR